MATHDRLNLTVGYKNELVSRHSVTSLRSQTRHKMTSQNPEFFHLFLCQVARCNVSHNRLLFVSEWKFCEEKIQFSFLFVRYFWLVFMRHHSETLKPDNNREHWTLIFFFFDFHWLQITEHNLFFYSFKETNRTRKYFLLLLFVL